MYDFFLFGNLETINFLFMSFADLSHSCEKYFLHFVATCELYFAVDMLDAVIYCCLMLAVNSKTKLQHR